MRFVITTTTLPHVSANKWQLRPHPAPARRFCASSSQSRDNPTPDGGECYQAQLALRYQFFRPAAAANAATTSSICIQHFCRWIVFCDILGPGPTEQGLVEVKIADGLTRSRMKYLPLRDIDTVTNALNFSTQDCHVIGGCDIYTTKAAGGDKKLYKNIENSLESQYESLVRLSASLSPPYRTRSEDGNNSEKAGSRKRGRTAEPEIDLSRASPFGPLSQISSRRTFAYLIATLNASHPDYDFSHMLRPSDFRKERSLRTIMHNFDSTLQHLRPRQTSALNYLSPPSLSSSAPGPTIGSEIWNQSMWKLIDKEMSLRHCEKYSYAPDDDPFDGDEGSIWSTHYFFFNKEKKRVCYLYLRGFSVISHSPLQAALSASGSRPAPRKVSNLSVGDGAEKRASFWLSQDLLSRNIDTSSYGEDDDDEMTSDFVDDEIEVPYMDLDEIRSELVNGRFSYPIEEEDDYDYDQSWTSPHHVRGMSEEIGAMMEE